MWVKVGVMMDPTTRDNKSANFECWISALVLVTQPTAQFWGVKILEVYDKMPQKRDYYERTGFKNTFCVASSGETGPPRAERSDLVIRHSTFDIGYLTLNIRHLTFDI